MTIVSSSVSSIQASSLLNTIESTSAVEETQVRTQLESESLSEKADLECDEKEKLSELLTGCVSGENHGTSSSPVVASKSLSMPISSSASLPLSVVSNAMNIVPNVTANVGSDTNLTDSNVEAVSITNTPSTHIPTPSAVSAQLMAGGTTPTSPLSITPMVAVKNCEYLNACVRFKNVLGLPGEDEHVVCIKKTSACVILFASCKGKKPVVIYRRITLKYISGPAGLPSEGSESDAH